MTNERVTMTGRIVSIKSKYGRYGDYYGVTVVYDGTKKLDNERLAWFRRSAVGDIEVGDTITFTGTPSGGSDDGKMTFLSRVRIDGEPVCGHFRLIRTDDAGYVCESCGEPSADILVRAA